jgi:hypothetical protein
LYSSLAGNYYFSRLTPLSGLSWLAFVYSGELGQKWALSPLARQLSRPFKNPKIVKKFSRIGKGGNANILSPEVVNTQILGSFCHRKCTNFLGVRKSPIFYDESAKHKSANFVGVSVH